MQTLISEKLMRYFIVLLLTAIAMLSSAQELESTRHFDSYTVHYSVFNSLLVPAEVADIHGLVRAGDVALINIAVQDREAGEAVGARVSGTARNLMQQSKPLDFKLIEEPDASYAIAELRHSNREVFHFDLEITPAGAEQPLHLKFVRKLYRE